MNASFRHLDTPSGSLWELRGRVSGDGIVQSHTLRIWKRGDPADPHVDMQRHQLLNS